MKSEAVFVDHREYLFQNILDTLQIRPMCHIEENLSSVYIQESQWERFQKNCGLLLPWRIFSLLFKVRGVDSIFFSDAIDLTLRVGCRRMRYQEIWSSCIRDHGMDGRNTIFMTSVTTRVKPL